MKIQLKSILFVVVVLAAALAAVPAFASDAPHWLIPPDAVVYSEDGSVNIWCPDADGWFYPAMSLTAEEIAAYAETPAEHTLVKSSGTVSVYKLNTGEWQVSNGPDAEGKVNVIVFTPDFATYSHWYEWNLYTLTVTAMDAGA